jgi:hypothetical protein
MTEQLGAPGETCRECHAPLATDQRYCLACGARRGDARVPVPGVRRRAATVVPAATRAGGNTTLVAGVATLVLAMGVGVLIGHAARDQTPARAAGPPQVIRVSGGAAAADTTAQDVPATPSASTKKSRRAKRSRTSTAAAKHKTKATNPAIKKLSGVSAKDYSKQSKKLPKTLGTGGKPPPKDKKKPAGGGGFQSIG